MRVCGNNVTVAKIIQGHLSHWYVCITWLTFQNIVRCHARRICLMLEKKNPWNWCKYNESKQLVFFCIINECIMCIAIQTLGILHSSFWYKTKPVHKVHYCIYTLSTYIRFIMQTWCVTAAMLGNILSLNSILSTFLLFIHANKPLVIDWHCNVKKYSIHSKKLCTSKWKSTLILI